MTDLELIKNWPDRLCSCGKPLYPSLSDKLGAGKFLLIDKFRTGTDLTDHIDMVWTTCSRCSTARSLSRKLLEMAARDDPYTTDMSRWAEKMLGYTPTEEDEEMADPLTVQEIMALSPDQRAKLIQLRGLVKDLQAAGIDPARLRATVAQK
jgi:hypothetical protein